MEVIVKKFGKKTEILKKEGNKFEIICGEKPENNKANLEIEKFFSKYFNRKVKIVSGFKNKRKLLKFE